MERLNQIADLKPVKSLSIGALMEEIGRGMTETEWTRYAVLLPRGARKRSLRPRRRNYAKSRTALRPRHGRMPETQPTGPDQFAEGPHSATKASPRMTNTTPAEFVLGAIKKRLKVRVGSIIGKKPEG